MSTFFGIVTGLALLFFAIFSQGGVRVFLNPHALMIAVGGTLAATFISFPLPAVIRSFGVLFNVFRSDVENPSTYIHHLIDLSLKARRHSLLSLEENAKAAKNRFLKIGLELMIDGQSPETIREVLETEAEFMVERHRAGSEIFRAAGRYAPAFGLIGTLIGLIAMLRAVAAGDGDTRVIGAGMAVALVTTFYGALMANLFFYPVAEKLRSRTREELLLVRVLLDGILLIQQGTNPRIIERRLNAHLPPGQRRPYRFR